MHTRVSLLFGPEKDTPPLAGRTLMRILVYQETKSKQSAIARYLVPAGYGVDLLSNDSELFSLLAKISYDLIVIDADMATEEARLSLLANLSAETKVPILVVTRESRPLRRAAYLESGAADVMTKPIHAEEFLARVRAILRRYERQKKTLRFSDLILNPQAASITAHGATLFLKQQELVLLTTLLRNKNRVTSRVELSRKLKLKPGSSANALEAVVSRSRKYLRELNSGVVIAAVRRGGYRLLDRGSESASSANHDKSH